MFNKTSFIIKGEIFRHILAEEFSLLNEDPKSMPEIISWFHGLDKGKKRRIITEVNTIFLYNLSKDKNLQKYMMKNYLRDEALCLNLFQYVSGKFSLVEDYFKPYVATMYGTYLVRFYLNPKGFFGKKAIITGNKELDAIVLEVIQTQFQAELGSKDNKDLPSEFDGILDDLETEINDILTTHEEEIKNRIDEGWLDPNKVEKLLSSVQHIFYLNQATVKTMRAILKGMNVVDMKKITAGGRSNTSNILALGIMRRSAELLYQVKLTDPILDKMLGLLAYRLMSQNSIYYTKLKPALANFIYKKMNQVRQPKNKISQMSARAAQYAGG